MTSSNANTNAYSSLIVGVILIGTSPILIKLADAPGIITSFYRMAIGTIALLPFFIHLNIKNKTQLPVKGIVLGSLGGVCLATDMALWTTGIVASNATLPTIVANMAPIWVGLGTHLFLKEKQSVGFWLGIVLAVSGVFFLIKNDLSNPGATLKGILLGLGAGFFYAGYQIFTQPGRKHLNTINYLFISTLATSITTGIYALIFKMNFTGYSQETWLYWLAMGVGIQVICWFLINYSQGYIPASVVSPTLLLQPVATAIIAFSLLGERFSFFHLLGGAIIITGVYVVHFTRRKPG